MAKLFVSITKLIFRYSCWLYPFTGQIDCARRVSENFHLKVCVLLSMDGNGPSSIGRTTKTKERERVKE